MKLITFAFLISLSGVAFAGTQTAKVSAEIPTADKEFVEKINGFDKAKIIEQLGEPSKVEDVQSSAGKAFASIWQYHYINTNDKGEYYQTTELDFIDDKVVMVVFMNNDGKEVPADAVKVTPGKK
jgi:hypothetical protein